MLQYLNSLPECKAINIHGSVFCERGTPDIVGSIRGRMFLFEAKKSEKETPEEIQEWRLAQWRASGVVAECIRSVEDVKRIMELNGLYSFHDTPVQPVIGDE